MMKNKTLILFFIIVSLLTGVNAGQIRIVSQSDTSFNGTNFDKIVTVGDTFSLELWINSNNIPVNGVSAYMKYDSNLLLLLDTDNGNSIKTDTNIREIHTVFGDIFENREPLKGVVNYSALTNNNYYSGDVLIAQMTFLAYNVNQNAEIIFDFDEQKNRETAMVNYDSFSSVVSSDSADRGLIKIIPAPAPISWVSAKSGNETALIEWSATTISDSNYYKIYYDTKYISNLNTAKCWDTIICASGDTDIIITGLTNYIIYYFTVIAVDITGKYNSTQLPVASCIPSLYSYIDSGLNENGEFELRQRLFKPIINIANLTVPSNNQMLEIVYPLKILANDYDTLVITAKNNMDKMLGGKAIGKVFNVRLLSEQKRFSDNLSFAFKFPDNLVSSVENIAVMYSTTGNENDWKPVENGFTVSYLPDKVKIDFEVNHLTFFGVFDTGPALNLSDLRVYPNPFVPSSNSESGRSFKSGDYTTGIIFANITATTKIWIYSITGELVTSSFSANGANKFHWDAKNQNGIDVATGIYIYIVKDNNGNVRTGKIAIVR